MQKRNYCLLLELFSCARRSAWTLPVCIGLLPRRLLISHTCAFVHITGNSCLDFGMFFFFFFTLEIYLAYDFCVLDRSVCALVLRSCLLPRCLLISRACACKP